MEKHDMRQLFAHFLLAMLLLAFLGGCKGRPSFENRLDPSVRGLLVPWKSDPLGCNGVRTDQAAAAIAEGAMRLDKVRAQDIEASLGPAEYTQVRNGLVTYGYYYDAQCVDDEIPEGAVFCVLEFFFDESGILMEAGPVCG